MGCNRIGTEEDSKAVEAAQEAAAIQCQAPDCSKAEIEKALKSGGMAAVRSLQAMRESQRDAVARQLADQRLAAKKQAEDVIRQQGAKDALERDRRDNNIREKQRRVMQVHDQQRQVAMPSVERRRESSDEPKVTGVRLPDVQYQFPEEPKTATEQQSTVEKPAQHEYGGLKPLVGTNTDLFRSASQSIIFNDGNRGHVLDFLLDANGDFWKAPVRDHATLADNPQLVQMMHVTSKKAGEPELVALGTAFNNQRDNATVESRHKGWVVNVIIDIGGIGVELRSAKDWVRKGWLAQDVLDSAPRIDLAGKQFRTSEA